MEDDGNRLMGLAASGQICLQTALRRIVISKKSWLELQR